MKTPDEIIKYWCKNDMGGLKTLIHITQIDAYNQAIVDCASQIKDPLLSNIIYADTPEIMLKNIKELKQSILKLKK